MKMDEEWLNDESEGQKRRGSHIRSCSVTGCTSKGYRLLIEGERVQYFPFPQYEPDLCRRWLQVCKLPPSTSLDKAFVCSKHFRPNDYKARGNSEKKLLRRTAVPSYEPVVNTGKSYKLPAKKKKVTDPSYQNHQEYFPSFEETNTFTTTFKDEPEDVADETQTRNGCSESYDWQNWFQVPSSVNDEDAESRSVRRNVAVKHSGKRRRRRSTVQGRECRDQQLLDAVLELTDTLQKKHYEHFSGFAEFVAGKLNRYPPLVASNVIHEITAVLLRTDNALLGASPSYVASDNMDTTESLNCLQPLSPKKWPADNELENPLESDRSETESLALKSGEQPTCSNRDVPSQVNESAQKSLDLVEIQGTDSVPAIKPGVSRLGLKTMQLMGTKNTEEMPQECHTGTVIEAPRETFRARGSPILSPPSPLTGNSINEPPKTELVTWNSGDEATHPDDDMNVTESDLTGDCEAVQSKIQETDSLSGLKIQVLGPDWQKEI